jgi:NAD(P)-dependent dehydrogenase (short-subunit alcohol dehydrogenase family)
MIFVEHELPVNVGALDVLVNIASIYPNQTFDAMPIAAWRPMFAVNVESMFLTCQVFMPAVKRYSRVAS